MEATSQKSLKKRILFWGEDLTLSHVVRPLVLADAIRDQYEIIFVTGSRYLDLVTSYGFTPHQTWTLSNELFMERLGKGKDGWDSDELSRQVKDELDLIKAYSPDLVVGDLRWSLGTSTELTNTPYMSIVNAYWGPYCTLPVPTPEFPFVKVIGVTLSSKLLPLMAPSIFKKFAKPYNAVRREYGLNEYGEYREIPTEADWVVYPDLPALAPTQNLPDHHHYLGPVEWSPSSDYPDWWDKLPDDKPIIYLAMGSTGRVGVVDTLVETLSEMPLTVMLSTSNRLDQTHYPANFYIAEFLPGIEACRRSNLVICNGGAGTIYQAIAEKTPILGIPTNADQYYVSEALARQGSALYIRSTHVTKNAIQRNVNRLLTDETFIQQIDTLQREQLQYDPKRIFGDLINNILS
ncbi:MAG: nucleotide disphospho-sugar-binding domain-containing protein [Candidatus Thiodiazotropha sp.]